MTAARVACIVCEDRGCEFCPKVARDKREPLAARETLAANLRRNQYATSPYARGYRAGARAALDTDPPPPGTGSPERAEYRNGFHDGRRDREAAAPRRLRLVL